MPVSDDPPCSADAVVIGAGSLGASVAFHLVDLGVERVVLVERSDAVSQTTRRAAGLSCELQPTAFLTRMASSSVRLIETFERDTGETFPWHQPGSLKLATSDEMAQRLASDVERGRRTGIGIELVTAAEAAKLTPFVEPAPIRAASYTPTDVYFEPDELPRAYLRAAQRRGLDLRANTAVTAIGRQGDRVASVVTSAGTIGTPVVVDTAGAWSALLGELAGVSVAIVPVRHHLRITEPIEAARPDLPIVRLMNYNVYARPCRGGLMLGAYEPAPMLLGAGALTRDFDIDALEMDGGVLDTLARDVAHIMPVLASAPIAELRGGLPTMTADGNPLLGPLPGLRGFFVLTGCCVGGLSKSPAYGRALATWIVDGKPDEDLSEAAPDRFEGRFDSAQALVDACAWQYAHHYHKA
ncbi:MAG: FAD-dependent oxidoreductase [Phycisphaeraceae bacterium]|nr:FAD-dependent oxidoreductase [Phycisphaeraceae bacterium]